jgi:oxygen-independent coproporphyrinogen-3 oxidase
MNFDFGIYVHTPWCRTRCPYCAFNVFLNSNADYEGWHDAVVKAWMDLSTAVPGSAHSLYFGGGTPSLAPPGVIKSLISTLPLQQSAEVTLEANPGTISRSGLEDLREAGVNRLSLGIQTFEPRHAKRLGRGHNVQQARDLVGEVHAIGFDSWSVDLMFALPGQTLAELKTDVDTLLELEPPHVSLYGLTIEPGTPFAAVHSKGEITLPPSELWRAMYDHIVSTLESAGLERYEVSNFALPGHRGRHNESTWRGGHYVGLGPGAHGFLPDGRRTMGVRDVSEWMADPHPAASLPSEHEAAIDLILSTMRHIDGVQTSALRARSGHGIDQTTLSALEQAGLICRTNDRLQLTTAAFPVADGIVRRLCEGLYLLQNT